MQEEDAYPSVVELDVEVRIYLLKVRTWWNHAFLEYENGFQHSSQPTGCFEMADIGLHGASAEESVDVPFFDRVGDIHIEGLVYGATGPEYSSDGAHLDRISNWSASPCSMYQRSTLASCSSLSLTMSFEIARQLVIEASFAIYASDELLLGITTGLDDRWRTTILV